LLSGDTSLIFGKPHREDVDRFRVNDSRT